MEGHAQYQVDQQDEAAIQDGVPNTPFAGCRYSW